MPKKINKSHLNYLKLLAKWRYLNIEQLSILTSTAQPHLARELKYLYLNEYVYKVKQSEYLKKVGDLYSITTKGYHLLGVDTIARVKYKTNVTQHNTYLFQILLEQFGETKLNKAGRSIKVLPERLKSNYDILPVWRIKHAMNMKYRVDHSYELKFRVPDAYFERNDKERIVIEFENTNKDTREIRKILYSLYYMQKYQGIFNLCYIYAINCDNSFENTAKHWQRVLRTITTYKPRGLKLFVFNKETKAISELDITPNLVKPLPPSKINQINQELANEIKTEINKKNQKENNVDNINNSDNSNVNDNSKPNQSKIDYLLDVDLD